MKRVIGRAAAVLKGERGITGLETAIVLIAFVVVSSVFAFSALSTGLFSSDQAKETIKAGLAETQGTMEVSGSAVANSTIIPVTSEAVGTGNAVLTAFDLAQRPVLPGSMSVTVGGTAKTEGVDYSVTYTADPAQITFTSAPANGAAIVATYKYYTVNSIVFQLGNAAGGKAVDLTPGQTILSYVDADNIATSITNYGLTWLGSTNGDNLLDGSELAQITVSVSSYTLTEDKPFTISVKPKQGAVLQIKRQLPGINTVVTLN